jgi:hypothetical protein
VFLPNLVVVWIATIAPAQVNHTRQGTAKTLRVASHLVTVNAVVGDKSGNPVTDLKPSDFEILDGGQAQKLSFFLKYSDAPPAAVQSDRRTPTRTL